MELNFWRRFYITEEILKVFFISHPLYILRILSQKLLHVNIKNEAVKIILNLRDTHLTGVYLIHLHLKCCMLGQDLKINITGRKS